MAHNARKTWLAPEHIIDVFVYVVVLNLVAQYAPHVMTETFAISLLAALLLKVVLELVLMLKKRALGRVRGASSAPGRAVGILTLLVLLPASKFVVLVLVDVVFGDLVSLGGFFAVTGLIALLMAARGGVRLLLGEPDGARP